MPSVEDLTNVELASLREPSVIAMTAVFAAATFIGTRSITVPVGPGVFNVGEIVIYTAAFLFGGVVAGLAGGIGAAAFDVSTGAFAFFAPFTLVFKGLEGYIVGQLAGETVRSKVIAVLAGAPVMIIGYTVTVAYFYGIPAAIGGELPIDILQAAIGLAVALPVSQALQDRLPRLR